MTLHPSLSVYEPNAQTELEEDPQSQALHFLWERPHHP